MFIDTNLSEIVRCYSEFEERVGMMEDIGVKSTAYEIVKRYVDTRLGRFTSAEVIGNCPGIGNSSVYSALKKFIEEGYVEKHGERRNAFYVKHMTDEW